VVDAGSGVGGPVAPPIFRHLGCTVWEIACTPDGNFPVHHPDPTVPENLELLIQKVRAEGADLGIAYDGDADRIGAVDEQGNIVWGDELLMIFARDVLQRNPKATIISEVKCSQRLYDDIVARGGIPIMWKAGHSLLKAKLKETNSDGPFSGLLADLPRTVSTPEIRIDCPDDRKFIIVERAKEYFRGHYNIIDIDGVRVQFPEGWGLIRASNTQPALVLRFEAQTAEKMGEYRALVEGKLKHWRSDDR
jgi:phosphomannomutase/phosphoglucomutase